MIKKNAEGCFKQGKGGEAALISLPLNKRQMTWASMLCNIGDAEEFIQIYQKSPSSELAIMRYRSCLHNKCTIVVQEIDLCNAFNTTDKKGLHNLLQDMFLEVINQADYDYAIKCIDNSCDNLREVYHMHNKDKGLKLKRVLLQLLAK